MRAADRVGEGGDVGPIRWWVEARHEAGGRGAVRMELRDGGLHRWLGDHAPPTVMPAKAPSCRGPRKAWWSPALAQLWTRLRQQRRYHQGLGRALGAMQRHQRVPQHRMVERLQQLQRRRNEAARELREMQVTWRRMLRRAKRRSWRELLQRVNTNNDNTLWQVLRGRQLNANAPRPQPGGVSQQAALELVAPNDVRRFWEDVWTATDDGIVPAPELEALRRRVALGALWADGNHDDDPDSGVYEAFSEDEVLRATRRLPTGRKAPGDDGVPNEVLKLVMEGRLARAMCDVANEVCHSAALPESWKRATVVLIPKQGSEPGRPDQYRPIALLSMTRKMVEKMLWHRLQGWARAQGAEGLLAPVQGGFRRDRGCSQQQMLLSAARTHTNRSGGTVWLALLDVRKAYDSVPHDVLLRELFRLRVPVPMIRMLMALTEGNRLCLRLNTEPLPGEEGSRGWMAGSEERRGGERGCGEGG